MMIVNDERHGERRPRRMAQEGLDGRDHGSQDRDLVLLVRTRHARGTAPKCSKRLAMSDGRGKTGSAP